MDEFLLVKFPESRPLLVNKIPQGRTNIVVRLEAGTYDIALDGRTNYSPDVQKVTLRFTAITNPIVLTFHELPPSALLPAAAATRA
jgi:hypothetical protein